jgi:hypothetical protein
MTNIVGMEQDPAYKVTSKTIAETRAIVIFTGPGYLKTRTEFGYFSIMIQGFTESLTNPKNWLFIVQDANKKEIYRDNGPDSRPIKIVSKYGTGYRNYHYINLMESPEFPLYVRIVTALGEVVDVTIQKK